MKPDATYLGCLDRQMEGFLTEADWERFLLSSILFERSIVVPDVFLFISNRLVSHLDQRALGQTLFERALRARVIEPALRDPRVSLVENLVLVRRQGIVGVLDNAEETAVRLSQSWPPPDSEPEPLRLNDQRSLFRHMVLSMLAEKPPKLASFSLEARKAWDLSRSWRQAAVDEACARTLTEDGLGLRRGHLMSAIGHQFGVQGEVHDVATLVKGITGRDQRRAAWHVIRWMNEIYQASGAAVLNTAPGFPASVPEYAIVPYELLPAGDDDGVMETMTLHIVVPPTHVLQQIAPDSVLGVRMEDGGRYLDALDTWKNGGANADEVRAAAESYCAKLVARAKKEGAKVLTRAELVLGRRIGTTMTNVLTTLISRGGAVGVAYLTGDPAFGVLYAMGGAAYKAVDALPESKSYQMVRRKQQQKQPHKKDLGRVGGIDVSLL